MKKINYGIIILFLFVNLIFLMDFPTVHSDELWLKGIAEHMLREKTFDTTEPFFDLYPRVVHPFRWLYNGVVIIALSFISPTVYSMRLISLFFGTLTLLIISDWFSRSLKSKYLSTLGLLLLSLDIQYIYASHMGRQETFILCLLVLGLNILDRSSVNPNSKKSPFVLAILTCLAMGVHPNSFILGVTFSGVLLAMWINKKQPLKSLFSYLLLTTAGAFVTTALGLMLNADFISQYFNYGTSLGVDSQLTNRFEGFYWYFYKLYYQIGGTYDLFNIRIQLVILFVSVLILTVLWIRHKQLNILLPIFIGLALSLLIIGRYNQLAIVFFSPFIILSLTKGLDALKDKKRVQIGLSIFVLIIWGTTLGLNLNQYSQQRFYTLSYQEMLAELSEAIPKDAVVLGNLNTLEAFDATHFYDIRNLGYLSQDTDAFETYIKTRKISYILVHEEMDYIYRTSPKWDFLYVNLDAYDSLTTFLNEHTVLIKTFENPLYAMRISKFSGTYPWATRIYKVIP